MPCPPVHPQVRLPPAPSPEGTVASCQSQARLLHFRRLPWGRGRGGSPPPGHGPFTVQLRRGSAQQQLLRPLPPAGAHGTPSRGPSEPLGRDGGPHRIGSKTYRDKVGQGQCLDPNPNLTCSVVCCPRCRGPQHSSPDSPSPFQVQTFKNKAQFQWWTQAGTSSPR